MTWGSSVSELFHERFRRLREAAALTKTALAGSTYTVSYVSQIEAGRRRPGPEALEYFADRLGASAHYLATGVPDGAESELALRVEQIRHTLRTGADPEHCVSQGREIRREAERWGLTKLASKSGQVIGDALIRLGRPTEAIDEYEEALAGAGLSERERGLCTVALATAYRTVGDLAYAADLIESYLRPTRPDPIEPAVGAELQSALASVYFERGDMFRAQRAAAGALAAAERGGTALARANALWTASRVKAEDRKWDEALEFATRAHAILEDLEDQRRLGLVNVACAYLCLESDPPNTGDARRHLDDAEALLVTLAAPSDLAAVYAERGRLALLVADADEALDYGERTLRHAGQDELARARALFLRGRAFALLNKHDKALASFEDALSSFQKMGARQQEASCWREIGELQLAADSVDAGIESLRAGLDAIEPRRSRP